MTIEWQKYTTLILATKIGDVMVEFDEYHHGAYKNRERVKTLYEHMTANPN